MSDSFIFEDVFESPIGYISLIATNEYLFRMYFDEYPIIDLEDGDEPTSNFITEQAKQFLASYFEGKPIDVKIPLAGFGTKFQNLVWDKVREIPFGEVCTYQYIAEKLEKPDARSVGAAIHNNHFPIIVPCHRVLPKNGKFSGYQDEVERKLWLLNFEREILEKQNSKGKK